MIKICSKCKKEKNCPEEFHKSKKRKDGTYSYRANCKKCSNKYLNERNLKNGKTKTPRGTPVEDLIGKKFGQLRVIKYNGQKQSKNRKRHIWLCQCSCDTKKEFNENHLKHGNAKSCGCAPKLRGKNSPNYKGHKEISGTIWYNIKYKATKRNLEFNITLEYVWNLFIKQNRKCAISEENISFSKTAKQHHYGHTTASLDRIDSSKGYIKGNIQWVHKELNRMKGSLSDTDFIEWCKKIVNNN